MASASFIASVQCTISEILVLSLLWQPVTYWRTLTAVNERQRTSKCRINWASSISAFATLRMVCMRTEPCVQCVQFANSHVRLNVRP